MNSSLLIACIDKEYHTRENCMKELNAAAANGKPIVVLSTQKDPLAWCTPEIKQLCDIPQNLFVDLGSIEEMGDWNSATPEMKVALETKLQELFKILNEKRVPKSLVHASSTSKFCSQFSARSLSIQRSSSTISSVSSNSYSHIDSPAPDTKL